MVQLEQQAIKVCQDLPAYPDPLEFLEALDSQVQLVRLDLLDRQEVQVVEATLDYKVVQEIKELQDQLALPEIREMQEATDRKVNRDRMAKRANLEIMGRRDNLDSLVLRDHKGSQVLLEIMVIQDQLDHRDSLVFPAQWDLPVKMATLVPRELLA